MKRHYTLYGMLGVTILLMCAFVISGTIQEKKLLEENGDTIAKIKLLESLSANTDRAAIYIRNVNLATKKDLKKNLNSIYNDFAKFGSEDFSALQKSEIANNELIMINEIDAAQKEYYEEIFLLRDNMNIRNKVGVANILTVTSEAKYRNLVAKYRKMLDYEYGYYEKSSSEIGGRITAIRITSIILTLFALFIEFVIIQKKRKPVTRISEN